jgi:hypothetical protein
MVIRYPWHLIEPPAVISPTAFEASIILDSPVPAENQSNCLTKSRRYQTSFASDSLKPNFESQQQVSEPFFRLTNSYAAGDILCSCTDGNSRKESRQCLETA